MARRTECWATLAGQMVRLCRGTLAATLLALAGFGLALAEDSFFHTDDGCVVETHCAACLWHYGATPETPHILSVGPVSDFAEVLFVAPPILRCETTARASTSRGPPQNT
jgi:hypothetical protein